MSQTSRTAARFTGWSAILGGLLIYVTGALLLMVTGTDTDKVLRGAAMLTLPAEARNLFRGAMIADIFGFYLPILVIAGYFWRSLAAEAGAYGYMAVLAMGFYVTVGVSGAAIQQAVIHPLTDLYAAAADSDKAMLAAVWTSVANATQRGLWWSEGPAIFLWALIVGSQLAKAGWRGAFLLKLVGWFAGMFFVFGLFPQLGALTNACEMAIAGILPIWMISFGWQLLSQAEKGVQSGRRRTV